MKRFSLNLGLILLLVSPTLAQEINKQQWTLFHERTADWCPYCGTWGWDFKDKLISEFAGKPVVFTAIHHSGGLSNPTSIELGKNFSGTAQPIFYEGGTDINVGSSDQVAKLADAKAVVEFNGTLPAFAGIGIDAVLDETTDVLTIKSKVEVLDNIVGGDYYLSLYLLEDLTWTQASKGANAAHKNVLKSSLFSSTFGRKLASGNLQKGTIFSEDVAVTGITQNANNISVLGVIWNKSNNKYLFFNANEVNVAKLSATENDFIDRNLTVFASESGNVFVDISTNKEINNAMITMMDADGKLISTQKLNQIGIGDTRYSFNDIQKTGLVFVTVHIDNKKYTKQVMIP